MHSYHRIFLYGIALASILTYVPIRAQSFWLEGSRERCVSLEVYSVNYSDEADVFSGISFSAFLDGKFPLNEKLWFVTELPFVRADADVPYYYPPGYDNPAENSLGNPYFGLVSVFDNGKGALEVGIRLPFTDKKKSDALAYGLFSDFDRYGAFAPDVITVVAFTDATKTFENHTYLRGRLGPSAYYRTEDTGGDRIELFVHGGGQFGYETEQFRGWLGVNTVSILTEESLLFHDKSVIEFALGANLKLNNVEPGLVLRLPVSSEYNDLVTNIIGLNVTVNLP